MLGFGWQELIIILIIVLIIFGAGKLSGVGSALGRGINDFRSEAGNGDGEKSIEQGSSRRASGLTSQVRDEKDEVLVGSGAASVTRERREVRPEDI